jgi:ribosomal protein S18 acetylase RimI-like enzyme
MIGELVHVRRATPEDAAGIARLRASCRGGRSDGLPHPPPAPRDIAAREEHWRTQLAFLLGEHRPWIAESDRSVLGLVTAGPSRDDAAPARTAEVYELDVDDEADEAGVAEHLLAHAQRDMVRNGFLRITMWVERDDCPLEMVLRKGGWSRDGAECVHEDTGASVHKVRYSRLLDPRQPE